MKTSGELGFRHKISTRDDLWCCNILLLIDFVEVLLCCSCNRSSVKRRHRKNFVESVMKVSNKKKSTILRLIRSHERKRSTCRAFITKTTSGELGFRNRKSTRDDLLLTDVGVCFPKMTVAGLA